MTPGAADTLSRTNSRFVLLQQQRSQKKILEGIKIEAKAKLVESGREF
jgi:hypothetical protein